MKPDKLIAFLKAFLGFYALTLLFEACWPFIRGEAVDWDRSLGIAGYGGAFIGLGVVVLFTPKLVDWDRRKIRIETRFRGLQEFSWENLEAYSAYGRGLTIFMIKFEGQQTFQIAPVGFNPDQWREFREFLNDQFPEKKTWIWIGPFPYRTGKS